MKLSCEFSGPKVSRGQWSDLKTVRGYLARLRRNKMQPSEVMIAYWDHYRCVRIVYIVTEHCGSSNPKSRIWDPKEKTFRAPWDIARDNSAGIQYGWY